MEALRRLLVIALTMLAGPSAGAAESVFVIDKLLVGIHENEDLSSAIVKVLPTGSPLEVLARKGDKAQVKDEDGIVGWVDAAYLMGEPPAASQLAQLRRDKEELAKRLKGLESGKAKPGDDGGRVDALTNENTDLKSQLSAQKLRTSELETRITALSKAAEAAAGAADGSVDAELRQANVELTDTLEKSNERIEALEDELEDAQEALEEAGSSAGTGGSGESSLLFAVLVVVLLLASFAGGLFFMDYLNRRRHGGFRV